MSDVSRTSVLPSARRRTRHASWISTWPRALSSLARTTAPRARSSSSKTATISCRPSGTFACLQHARLLGRELGVAEDAGLPQTHKALEVVEALVLRAGEGRPAPERCD